MSGPASRFEAPDDSPGFLLWRVSNQWQARQRAALAPLRLTHVQFVLLAGLWWLARVGAAVNQAELARHTGTDAMVTSQVVRALQGRRLIRRAIDPADARARRLTLTPAGSTLVSRAMPRVEAVDAAFFTSLGPATGAFTAALVRLAKSSAAESDLSRSRDRRAGLSA